MKKPVVITIIALAAAVILTAGGAGLYFALRDEPGLDGYPPYIVVDGRYYKDDGLGVSQQAPKEGLREAGRIISLVPYNELTSQAFATNAPNYLDGVVYTAGDAPNTVYLYVEKLGGYLTLDVMGEVTSAP